MAKGLVITAAIDWQEFDLKSRSSSWEHEFVSYLIAPFEIEVSQKELDLVSREIFKWMC